MMLPNRLSPVDIAPKEKKNLILLFYSEYVLLFAWIWFMFFWRFLKIMSLSTKWCVYSTAPKRLMNDLELSLWEKIIAAETNFRYNHQRWRFIVAAREIIVITAALWKVGQRILVRSYCKWLKRNTVLSCIYLPNPIECLENIFWFFTKLWFLLKSLDSNMA